MLRHVDEQRVPSARQQAEEGRLERVGLEVERGDVAVQVVDGHERQPAAPGERLRGREADEQRADQAGALRDRDGLDVVQAGPGAVERLPEHRQHELEVAARGHLRHDPAEPCV